jgi:heat shock protein HslJ
MTPRSLRAAGLLLCSLPLLLAACGGGDDEPTPPRAAPEAPAPAPAEPPMAAAPETPAESVLTDVEWRLVAIQAIGAAPITPDPEGVPTLQFGSEVGPGGMPRMIGFNGCNRFFGDYVAGSDGRLEVKEPLGSTMMACPEPRMEVESAFMKALGSASRYSLEEDGLTVLYAEGALRFNGG